MIVPKSTKEENTAAPTRKYGLNLFISYHHCREDNRSNQLVVVVVILILPPVNVAFQEMLSGVPAMVWIKVKDEDEYSSIVTMVRTQTPLLLYY